MDTKKKLITKRILSSIYRKRKKNSTKGTCVLKRTDVGKTDFTSKLNYKKNEQLIELSKFLSLI